MVKSATGVAVFGAFGVEVFGGAALGVEVLGAAVLGGAAFGGAAFGGAAVLGGAAFSGAALGGAAFGVGAVLVAGAALGLGAATVVVEVFGAGIFAVAVAALGATGVGVRAVAGETGRAMARRTLPSATPAANPTLNAATFPQARVLTLIAGFPSTASLPGTRQRGDTHFPTVLSRRSTGYVKAMGEPVYGVSAQELSEEDLFRELEQLYETRFQTLRHGSDQALDTHTRRIEELENDYMRRYPQREVDPDRTREGARR